MAVVVGASELEWRGEALEAERFEAGRIEIDALQAPAHFLARDDLPAADFLRVGDRLSGQHRIVDAPIVEDLAEFAGRRLALAGVDDQFLDLGEGGIVRAAAVQHYLQETLTAVACRRDVVVVGPPDRDELVHREFGLDSFLDGGRVHRAPAVHHEEVRLVATNVEPFRRLILHVGRRDRIELQIEADVLGERLEQRDRLPAEAAVKVEVAERLALERLDRAAADIFEDFGEAVPIRGGRVENPREDVASCGGREAIAKG